MALNTISDADSKAVFDTRPVDRICKYVARVSIVDYSTHTERDDEGGDYFYGDDKKTVKEHAEHLVKVQDEFLKDENPDTTCYARYQLYEYSAALGDYA